MINEMIDMLSDMNNKTDTADYIKDGLLHCSICNQQKQVKISFAGDEKIVYCACECEMKKYNEMRKQLESENIMQIKKRCFPDISMEECTFENSDGTNQRAFNMAKRYVEEWGRMYSENIGLMFFGDVGTGKTYISLCIANALIDRNVPVFFTDFSRICNDMLDFSTGNNNDYIDSLNHYKLLIIDDFGAERTTDTAIQFVEDVVNARCKAHMPMLITTNKTVDEMKSCKNMKMKRIYSRILSMTVPIEVNGNDRRKKIQADKLMTAKELLLS